MKVLDMITPSVNAPDAGTRAHQSMSDKASLGRGAFLSPRTAKLCLNSLVNCPLRPCTVCGSVRVGAAPPSAASCARSCVRV